MKKIKVILVFLFLFSSGTFSQSIPESFKKCVSFVFVNYPKIGINPYGTGFFVSVTSEKDSIVFGYFVTSKHVFQNGNKQFFDSLYVRINRRDGLSDTIKINLFGNGKPLFYTHKDTTVDLVVYPMHPDNKRYDYTFIPSSRITTDDIYKNNNIHEGDEAFFTGLFFSHYGKRKNIPIVRFGRVALISEEKVMWGNVPMDLYLIETTSFGGNSGSPLFFSLNAPKKTNTLISIGREFFLGGIIQGYFGERLRHQFKLSENSGIAAIVPAKKLYEILYSAELVNLRKNIIEKIK